ncbi:MULTISPECIES: hypothetical protein [Halorussus]|uniref:hypothetical protein n=1 Tax=Halorussus TaxID=1070314 RepID=UPI000E210958|nr:MULTISPECIES: hypothetical protein [Halorussus]NHN59820.1 hypothetical protein [Halorussus sp. JP-T4]
MSKSSRTTLNEGGSMNLWATTYIKDGEILVGKLVSSLLGGLWLAVAGGWITVMQSINRVHIQILDAAAGMVVRIVEAAGGGGAETIRVAWAEAYRAAVAANPLLAPALMTLEIILVSALLLYARRRWT